MDEVFAFEDFLLDERELLLRHRGVAVPLPPKPPVRRLPRDEPPPD